MSEESNLTAFLFLLHSNLLVTSFKYAFLRHPDMPVEGPPSTPIAPNAKRQVIKSFFNESDTPFPFLNLRENEKVRVEVIKKKRIMGIIFIKTAIK